MAELTIPIPDEVLEAVIRTFPMLKPDESLQAATRWLAEQLRNHVLTHVIEEIGGVEAQKAEEAKSRGRQEFTGKWPDDTVGLVSAAIEEAQP